MRTITTTPRRLKAWLDEPNTGMLIPDYQRPYEWTVDECSTLWYDLLDFCLPANGNFDAVNDEYFLGNIIVFMNTSHQYEVIDGQQRLTSLTLMMRAFYEQCKDDPYYADICNKLAECLWLKNAACHTDRRLPKIENAILTDEDANVFNNIMAMGYPEKKATDNYSTNYKFFRQKIAAFKANANGNLLQLITRIFDNCYVMQMQAFTAQEALQMFTTLNNRGKPLTAADIFRTELYKIHNRRGQAAKDRFKAQWQSLVDRSNALFANVPAKEGGSRIEYLFTLYLYRDDNDSGRRPNLMEGYTANNFALLNQPNLLEDLKLLLDFLEDIVNQNTRRFSVHTLRYAHILLRTRSLVIWMALTNYFFTKRDETNNVDDADFGAFLVRLTAFLLINALSSDVATKFRGQAFKLLAGLKEPEFNKSVYGISADLMTLSMKTLGAKRVKKFAVGILLNWWTWRNEEQELPALDDRFDIEHIFAKARTRTQPLTDPFNLELLGNLALLEHANNVRATDYRFADKKNYYLGTVERKGRVKLQPTINRELLKMAHERDEFTEKDILARNKLMTDELLKFVGEQGFLIQTPELDYDNENLY